MSNRLEPRIRQDIKCLCKGARDEYSFKIIPGNHMDI